MNLKSSVDRFISAGDAYEFRLKKILPLTIAAVLLLLAAATLGVWWGKHQTLSSTPAAPAANMNSSASAALTKERKVRFYRNPMGLPDTSPTPKKDSMGMDYLPVYEGEDDAVPASGAAPLLTFSADKVQKLGVRTEPAALRVLDKEVRATGRVEADERRSYTIAPRFEGYVEKLFVNATGQSVTKGQPLLELYAPELLAAAREYTIAVQGVQALAQAGPQAQQSMQQLADASLARLRNWQVDEEQLRALAQSQAPRRTFTLLAPVSGYVSEKKAVQGMRFMAGDVLYQLSDLSTVWVMADVAEQDIALLRPGTRARVRINAYPERVFAATLAFVSPTLNTETRSVPVRLELGNPGALLKPGMFAEVHLAAAPRVPVLTVPVSAVIDTGSRQLVLVQSGPADAGRFAPREIKLGLRSDNYIQVLQGLRAGESVVVAANFLMDAESNLKAAIAGFGTGSADPATPAAPVSSSSKRQ